MDLIQEQSRIYVTSANEQIDEDILDNQYYIDNNGFVQFPDGSKFKGALKFGNPEGLGIMIYGDGSKYEGNFVSGNAEGYGILTFPDKSRYEGNWHIGKYNG